MPFSKAAQATADRHRAAGRTVVMSSSRAESSRIAGHYAANGIGSTIVDRHGVKQASVSISGDRGDLHGRHNVQAFRQGYEEKTSSVLRKANSQGKAIVAYSSGGRYLGDNVRGYPSTSRVYGRTVSVGGSPVSAGRGASARFFGSANEASLGTVAELTTLFSGGQHLAHWNPDGAQHGDPLFFAGDTPYDGIFYQREGLEWEMSETISLMDLMRHNPQFMPNLLTDMYQQGGLNRATIIGAGAVAGVAAIAGADVAITRGTNIARAIGSLRPARRPIDGIFVRSGPTAPAFSSQRAGVADHATGRTPRTPSVSGGGGGVPVFSRRGDPWRRLPEIFE